MSFTVPHPYVDGSVWYPTLDGVQWDPTFGLECIVSPSFSLNWDKRESPNANKANPSFKGQPAPTYSLELKAWRTAEADVKGLNALQVLTDLIVKLMVPSVIGANAVPQSISVDGLHFQMQNTKLVKGESSNGPKWDAQKGILTASVKIIDQSNPTPVSAFGAPSAPKFTPAQTFQKNLTDQLIAEKARVTSNDLIKQSRETMAKIMKNLSTTTFNGANSTNGNGFVDQSLHAEILKGTQENQTVSNTQLLDQSNQAKIGQNAGTSTPMTQPASTQYEPVRGNQSGPKPVTTIFGSPGGLSF